MKKLVAFIGISLIAVCVSLSAYSEPVKHDVKAEIAKVVVKSGLVFVNDAVTPSVSPVYGRCMYINAENTLLSEKAAKVIPSANIPPSYGEKGY